MGYNKAGMRYQTKPGYCGATAVVNALRCCGITRAERIVAARAKSDTVLGTMEDGIFAALEAEDFQGIEISTGKQSDAFYYLNEAIASGFPVIILEGRTNHWTLVMAKVAGNYIIADSTNEKFNTRENGTHIYTKRRLAWRWKDRTASNDKYYGIIVKPKGT